MFGFLLVAPFMITGIAYLAIVGAKPFREWVDARVPERERNPREKAGDTVIAAEVAIPADPMAEGSTPGSEEGGGASIARPEDSPFTAFAANPVPTPREFRGEVIRLPDAADGSVSFAFRDESGTTEVSVNLPADNPHAGAMRGIEPGQSRPTTLRLRWTEGENPHIVLDEWISWGYQGGNDETF